MMEKFSKFLIFGILVLNIFSIVSCENSSNSVHEEHDYVLNVVPPTCTLQGYTEMKCSVCGYTEKKDYIPALGHDFKDIIVSPTCTSQGYTEMKCSVCGYTEEKDYTAVISHDLDEQYKCRNCGLQYELKMKCDVSEKLDDSITASLLMNPQTSEYTLIISGEGKMYDYANGNMPEYSQYMKKIGNVIISDGVTSVGNYAFWGTWNIGKNVTFMLGKDIKSLGEESFGGLNIESINFPEGLETIGKYSFDDAKFNSEIVLPNSVTSLGNQCFNTSDSGMVKIVLPDCKNKTWYIFEEQGIGECICRESGLNEYEGAWYIPSATNPYFMLYKGSDSITQIHEDCKIIYDYAFKECSLLEKIEIPNEVKYIGTGAFNGCSMLTEIVLPGEIEYCAGYLFYGDKSLKKITITSDISNIGKLFVYQCYNLECIEYAGTKEKWDAIETDSLSLVLCQNTDSLYPSGKIILLVCSDGTYEYNLQAKSFK